MIGMIKFNLSNIYNPIIPVLQSGKEDNPAEETANGSDQAGENVNPNDPEEYGSICRDQIISLPGLPELNNVVIGERNARVTFTPETVLGRVSPINLQENCDKLVKIYDLINELNTMIPSRPIRGVAIVRQFTDSEYHSYDHRLDIALDENYLETTAHEMGHAIFSVLLGGNGTEDHNLAVKDELWQKIYYLSLGSESYEIVDDSNYYGEDSPEAAGHPYDDASELFASALAVYRLYPDRFLENLSNPETPEETLRVGRLIYEFMRDKIFTGRTFSERDLEAGGSEEIGEEELIAALINAYDNPDPDVRCEVARAIGNLGLGEERLIELLIKALGDEEASVRGCAVESMGRLGPVDERFEEYLVAASRDGSCSVRWEAVWVIGRFGLREDRFLRILSRALADRNALVRQRAIETIGELDIIDERFREPLNDALDDRDDGVRAAAAQVIAEFYQD